MKEILQYLTLQKALGKFVGTGHQVGATFFSIAAMLMFGLIELSELVARYSEGKSQGLSLSSFESSSS